MEGCRAHIEDSEDPVEIRLPIGNHIHVVPRMKKSKDFIPPTVFDDLLLHFRDSPTIDNTVGGRNRSVYCRSNSRR